jgi:hypothetical protein
MRYSLEVAQGVRTKGKKDGSHGQANAAIEKKSADNKKKAGYDKSKSRSQTKPRSTGNLKCNYCGLDLHIDTSCWYEDPSQAYMDGPKNTKAG